MKDITFSTDAGVLTIEDNIESGKLAEKYFEMESDPDQIPATSENVSWINKNITNCVNVIKYKGEIIGFTFIVPCTKSLMDKFLTYKLSENEMFEEVKKSDPYKDFDAIYICSAFIKPQFRRKGLALEGFVKSINKITGARKIKPILFYWEYTPEGGRMCKSIASKLKLELRKR